MSPARQGEAISDDHDRLLRHWDVEDEQLLSFDRGTECPGDDRGEKHPLWRREELQDGLLGEHVTARRPVVVDAEEQLPPVCVRERGYMLRPLPELKALRNRCGMTTCPLDETVPVGITAFRSNPTRSVRCGLRPSPSAK